MKLAFVLLPGDLWHLAEATRRWLVRGWGAEEENVCCRLIEPLDPGKPGRAPAWVAERFRELTAWVEREARERGGPEVLRDAIGIVDFYDPRCPGLEPGKAQVIGQETPMVALASLLVLAFPEIRWVPYAPYLESRNLLGSDDWPTFLCKLAAPDAGPFLALFDPFGLRENIRAWLRTDPEARGECSYLPGRALLAAAIDEEASYAACTGYLAYRHGYRSLVITTERLMEATLGEDTCTFRFEPRFEPQLTFEDLYLGFPDRSGGHLSSLQERDARFPGLRKARRRVFVTVGHARHPTRGELARQNDWYLRSQEVACTTLFKPLPGFHRVWRKARPRARETGAGAGSGFIWPPRSPVAGGEPHGHSTPGRLLAVAELLLARAAKILEAPSPRVEDAVHAATLALEAKELLGGKTATVAMNAILLQHEGEVLAESLFLGVERNLDLSERFREIRREIRFMGDWFHWRTRRRSALNARLTIIERLAKRFADLHQVEEEMACLAKARKLRFEFWMREKPYRWVLWPLLRYVAFALSSLGRFVAVVAAWIVLFGVVHYFLRSTPEGAGGSWLHALASSAYFFMTLQPCEGLKNHSTLVDAVLALQGCVAFLNLGLLLSHLYMVVSRR